MSNETSQVQNVVDFFKGFAAQQMAYVATFQAEVAKWNALQAAQAEHVAGEMQKLTKESFSYANDMTSEIRKAQLAAAKKGLAVFGVGS